MGFNVSLRNINKIQAKEENNCGSETVINLLSNLPIIHPKSSIAYKKMIKYYEHIGYINGLTL